MLKFASGIALTLNSTQAITLGVKAEAKALESEVKAPEILALAEVEEETKGLAPTAPRTTTENCFVDMYSVGDTVFGNVCEDGFTR